MTDIFGCTHWLPYAALLAFFAVGCGSDPNPNALLNGQTAAAPAGPTVDIANDVLAPLANQGYRTSANFTKMSNIYKSNKDANTDVVEWISTPAAPLYAQVAGSATPDVILPVGTIAVRAAYDKLQVDAAGTPPDQIPPDSTLTAITVMFKGPTGYDLDVGDWGFGVLNPDGTPMLLDPDAGAAGGQEIGQLTATCHSCHRDDQGLPKDFLFGVPAANVATN